MSEITDLHRPIWLRVLGLVGQLALYLAIVLYAHEFSQLGKQVNEVRRLVEERCR